MSTHYEMLVRHTYRSAVGARDHEDRHHEEDYNSYHIPLQEMHQSSLHGWGIAQGLQVQLSADGNELEVKSGVAIDKLGRMIILASDRDGAHWTEAAPGGNGRIDIDAVQEMPVKFNIGDLPNGSHLLLIQYAEYKLEQGGVDALEVVPSVRLQASVDDDVVILAAVTVADGPNRTITVNGRHLVSPSVGELRIKSSRVQNSEVAEVDAGNIGPNPNGAGLYTQELTTDTIHSMNFIGISDARLKTRVNPLTDVLARLERIRGVSFEWQEGRAASHAVSHQGPQIGVIAQEVEQVFPELVASTGAGAYKGVDYGKLSAVLLEGVKELKAANEALQRENLALAKRLSALEARLFAGAGT